MYNAFENDEDIDNYNRVVARNQLSKNPSAVVKGMVKSRRGWGGIVPGDVMVERQVEKYVYGPESAGFKRKVSNEVYAALLQLGFLPENFYRELGAKPAVNERGVMKKGYGYMTNIAKEGIE